MNGISQKAVKPDDTRNDDLLAHKYHPKSASEFTCHIEQASQLKQWILEFINYSNGQRVESSHSDYDDSNSDLMNRRPIVVPRCILLTGPPGIGKTSLVYTIAHELKLHVVEAHSSERRDSKLFSMLKLTNQKGKINAFAKMFQAAQKQQSEARRKRRKLQTQPIIEQNKPLSLCGDTSIVLFDDIDVVFEEDGPFLKSLVEFIGESKRPVVLTATKSIDLIRDILLYFDHIHLDKPLIEDCAKLLSNICRKERHLKLSTSSRCRALASLFNCDIRQCLNRIQFYGENADHTSDVMLSCETIKPRLGELKLIGSNYRQPVLDCFVNRSIVDLLDSCMQLESRSDLLEHWLDGRPSHRHENSDSNHILGEKIKESIVELTAKLFPNDLMTECETKEDREAWENKRIDFIQCSQKVNEKIKSRIEPPDCDFYTDILLSLGQLIRQEAENRSTNSGGFARRSRRVISYLETAEVFLEPEEVKRIAVTLLNPESLTETD